MELETKIRDILAEFLHDDIYMCTRSHEAWSYGTMSLDDFVPVYEDEDYLEDFTKFLIEKLDLK